jgi:hypothetical protein
MISSVLVSMLEVGQLWLFRTARGWGGDATLIDPIALGSSRICKGLTGGKRKQKR